jgi:hypothetical protein
MGLFQFRPRPLDQYFLDKKNPYSGRRPINRKALFGIGGFLVIGFVMTTLFFGSNPEEKTKGASFKGDPSFQAQHSPQDHDNAPPIPPPRSDFRNSWNVLWK